MAELSVDDVIAYTGLDDNDETERMLTAALAAARRYVGWHVSPIRVGDTATLDGPGGRILALPTQNITKLNSITEDGTELDLDNLTWSANNNQPVNVRKVGGGYWTDTYQGVEVDMDHGYSEADAAPWRHAILMMVNQMSAGGRPDTDLVLKRVDDVQYQWTTSTQQALMSVTFILDDYQVGRVVFA